MKTISVLGSTGSIGTQSLAVARENGYKIAALSANSNIDLLEIQAREFLPKIAVLRDEKLAHELASRLKDTSVEVDYGEQGILRAASLSGVEIAINALVGIAGLAPTLAIIENGSTLALANKESLVCAGELVNRELARKNAKILPVDSEHSAIFQALAGHDNSDIKKILLTASGGPFFGKTLDEMKNMTAADALKHPKWSMGNKITIDSATMVNKGFEVIEAMWLFGVPCDKIEVVVHRESIVHSMVEFADNCVMAQMSVPDMRLPIQYALTYPERVKASWQELDLIKTGALHFELPDRINFPALALCEKASRDGGNTACAINAANEIAVDAFLNGKIKFTQIYQVIECVVKQIGFTQINAVKDVFECDSSARELAHDAIGELAAN